MTTAIVCIALLSALLFILGFNVSRLRGKSASHQPTAMDDPLFVAIRAHGNAAEYIPTLAVLMLIVGSHDPATWMLVAIAVVTAARSASLPCSCCDPDRCNTQKGRPVTDVKVQELFRRAVADDDAMREGLERMLGLGGYGGRAFEAPAWRSETSRERGDRADAHDPHRFIPGEAGAASVLEFGGEGGFVACRAGGCSDDALCGQGCW